MMTTDHGHTTGLEIAVVGMSCRFPGAPTIEAFWENLRDGVESITFFTEKELDTLGVSTPLRQHPDFVGAAGALSDVDQFDAGFFGYTPREAELIDPQQRLFLECAWEALERAGYDPADCNGIVGVYGGLSTNSYLKGISGNRTSGYIDHFQMKLATDKDFLAPRVAYKLNLEGPAVVVQTACSTSLVAVHLACQSLLAGECDVALAGGASVTVPSLRGYLYQKDGIAARDGHCRSFDASASGTVPGNGVGIVALKRLADALADGDHIEAVIKGSAINNDGADKIGYTAPRVEGQANVIAAAQTMAEVEPETITYVEAHGTATSLGDPIEIAALNLVFRNAADQGHTCAIGSAKTNFGHLDAAAGVAGLIKTVLAIKHRTLPPSLHFEKPNPKIDFEHSAFKVNTQRTAWEANGLPLRAGVSSFGIGGTNAHVIVQEAPTQVPRPQDHNYQLLLMSARSGPALEATTKNLRQHLAQHDDLNLADVAYTLQVGRRAFAHRRAVVCPTASEAAAALDPANESAAMTANCPESERRLVFMFTGQGAQYVNMARGLYESHPVFRTEVDRCCDVLAPHLVFDLRSVLYPSDAATDEASNRMNQTAVAQPALFVIEYALAKLWMAWGLKPQAMIGHSIGEYVAACLAGVFALDDVLPLVAERGRLMQACLPGTMVAIPLPAEEIKGLLDEHLSLAAVNTPQLCVVSGPSHDMERFENRLTAKDIVCRHLSTSHAFHSAMMDPLLRPFGEAVSALKLAAPQTPFISNLSGTWITDAEATDPAYWARHLRETVHFSPGLETLLTAGPQILLEIGPGKTLASLAKQHIEPDADHAAIASLHHPLDRHQDDESLLTAAGRLWLAGAKLDFATMHETGSRRRVLLPTYPFERRRYWVEAKALSATTNRHHASKRSDIADWFYVPSWQRANLAPLPGAKAATTKRSWCLLSDESELSDCLAKRLRAGGHSVTTVATGSSFEPLGKAAFRMDPNRPDDYDHLISALSDGHGEATSFVHLWGNGDEALHPSPHTEGFHSLLNLVQAIARCNSPSGSIMVITDQAYDVMGNERIQTSASLVHGLCKVIHQEHPTMACRCVDVHMGYADETTEDVAVRLHAELLTESDEPTVAHRGPHRWVPVFNQIRYESVEETPSRLRPNGVYLITGGLGGVGAVLAAYLAKSAQAKLILTGRTALPPRTDWDAWLETHEPSDSIGLKIRRVRALEKAGGEVIIEQADVTSVAQMRDVVHRAVERFGRIDGTIHAAGVVHGSSLRPLAQLTQDDGEQQFAPKVRGLHVLQEVLADQSADFCLLTSSLSSLLGGLGFGAYAAANAYLDAFAQARHREGDTRWLSINWDGWRFDAGGGDNKTARSRLADLAITSAQGADAFGRILSAGTGPQVAVSTGDLSARIAQWVTPSTSTQSEKEPDAAPPPQHPRPRLQNDYIEPTGDRDRSMAEIWQSLLGIDKVGVTDNFFELGGDSVTALQLISRLKSSHQLDLSVVAIYESPTIEALLKQMNNTAGGNAGLETSEDRGEARLALMAKRRRNTGG